MEAYSAMWPAKVAQKVRVEADELKERIWLRWERLLGAFTLFPPLPFAN